MKNRKIAKFISIIFIIFFITGCAGIMDRGETKRPRKNSGKVALVLGGGLMRGYAHVGVLRVLEREEIPIDMIIGNETGALIASFYAAQASSFDLEWKIFQAKKSQFFDDIVFGSGESLMAGKGIQSFISTHLSAKNIDELSPKIIVTATDMRTGSPVIFEDGDPKKVLSAAMAIPGIYPVVSYQGKLLASGGISSGQLPIDEAIARNVDLVIAVDPMASSSPLTAKNLNEVLAQAYYISSRAITAKEADIPVIIITPNLRSMSPFEFDRRKEAMVAGMRSAEAALPAIRRALQGAETN